MPSKITIPGEQIFVHTYHVRRWGSEIYPTERRFEVTHDMKVWNDQYMIEESETKTTYIPIRNVIDVTVIKKDPLNNEEETGNITEGKVV
jgi:7-cyano-7-deazaguanine synthase in queuosine biosynthesis